jgi:hypothetical protein
MSLSLRVFLSKAVKRSPSAAAWPFLANSPARRILSRHCARAHESLQMLYYRHTHRLVKPAEAIAQLLRTSNAGEGH